MIMRLIAFTFLLGVLVQFHAQEAPFNLEFEALTIPELGGLQSYAFGQYNGEWIIVGGRLDGLHRRQPFAAFDKDGHNTSIFLIDPLGERVVKRSILNLSQALKEQLSSTNMEFVQEGNTLYLFGGYGFSETYEDHITFPSVIAIDLEGLTQALKNNKDITSYFTQKVDSAFAVTGGQMEKMGDRYYLIGGQKFNGRYNPMGPDFGPGFVQEYTNEVRVFQIEKETEVLNITHFLSLRDTSEMHRRDFNTLPQIYTDGSEGITAFSGVFRRGHDLPYLNTVEINATGMHPNARYQQYYNHYHCATIPLYNAENQEMHNIFLGGIAQFYDSSGVLVQDNDVPFTKGINRVTRKADGSLEEWTLPLQMPDYMGAAAEFIVHPDIPMYRNEVIKQNELRGDRVLLGYVYGGIRSSARNIFFINDGEESNAVPTIYKVYLTNDSTSHKLNSHGYSSLNLDITHKISEKYMDIDFTLLEGGVAHLSIYTISGKKVLDKSYNDLKQGRQHIHRKSRHFKHGGSFILKLDVGYEKTERRIEMNP